jgi:hypothetical protein
MADRSIFRETAVDAYRRRFDRDVVPRLRFRLTVACCWVLIAVLLAAALTAWAVRVPRYVSASGVVVTRSADRAGRETTRLAIVFAPPRSGAVRVGQPVRAQIGSSESSVAGAVASVSAGVIGPEAVSIRYRLHGGSALPSEPSRVVTVRLRTPLPARAYAGTRVTARIEVGSRRLLAVLPGVGKLLAGS